MIDNNPEQAFAELAEQDDLYQLEEDEPLPYDLKLFWLSYEAGSVDILDYPIHIEHKQSYYLYVLLAEADYEQRQYH